MMVIGAACRDILHASYGHSFVLRATRDIDVALSLSEWEPYDRLTQSLRRAGHTGIRYLVRDIPVDLMPFGDVEDPTGVVTPAARREAMDVFALREVFEHSSTLSLGEDLQIRIPSAAGYCALKMSAWANRSTTGESRDAPDIAAALYWYMESEAIGIWSPKRPPITCTSLIKASESSWPPITTSRWLPLACWDRMSQQS
jgi:predicted nucleotidyltransferase